ncbi:MAG: hypothetical protein TE42_02010 [Candidatus Synechococcus spongiarum SP3]|uniref:Uncharacterized protein n=1 Tax=Candidatus Synechococcus spongiarum SP3 TaxID=1604020 RepID=A0A0G2HMB7_9SYNE|nr:MAG: hypothetical protein TE42_02010 [Candidatus Synechococcus spongiarum SP3]
MFIASNVKLIKEKKSITKVSAGCLQIRYRVYGYRVDAGGIESKDLHSIVIIIQLIFNMKLPIFMST